LKQAINGPPPMYLNLVRERLESAGVEFIDGSIVRSGREVEKSRSRIEQLSPENDLVKDDAVCGVALDDATIFREKRKLRKVSSVLNRTAPRVCSRRLRQLGDFETETPYSLGPHDTGT
jgi:hypothetical protein